MHRIKTMRPLASLRTANLGRTSCGHYQNISEEQAVVIIKTYCIKYCCPCPQLINYGANIRWVV